MFVASALFLTKKYGKKLHTHAGGTHKNMRDVIDFYTQDKQQHEKLMAYYEFAIEQYKNLSEQYFSETHFAKKVVKDLMYKGYNEGKKVEYYQEMKESAKDPLALTMADAKEFIQTVVEPFLSIMEKITND